MHKAEKILKQLDLDYKTVVKDAAWNIKPMDFLCKASILLIDTCASEHRYNMLLIKGDDIIEEKSFNQVGNITDIYSYLYNYDYKNLTNKTKRDESIRSN